MQNCKHELVDFDDYDGSTSATWLKWKHFKSKKLFSQFIASSSTQQATKRGFKPQLCSNHPQIQLSDPRPSTRIRTKLRWRRTSLNKWPNALADTWNLQGCLGGNVTTSGWKPNSQKPSKCKEGTWIFGKTSHSLFAHPDDHKPMPQILAIGSNFGILAFLNLEEPAWRIPD